MQVVFAHSLSSFEISYLKSAQLRILKKPPQQFGWDFLGSHLHLALYLGAQLRHPSLESKNIL